MKWISGSKIQKSKIVRLSNQIVTLSDCHLVRLSNLPNTSTAFQFWQGKVTIFQQFSKIRIKEVLKV